MTTIFTEPIPISIDGAAQGAAQNLAEHRRCYGHANRKGLLESVGSAGLVGHGGAKFPVARKWQAAIDAGGSGIVVCNGAESEPASGKDAALLQLRTHLVLDGLVETVNATDATSGVIWVHDGSLHSRHAIERSLIERQAAGLLDPPIAIAEGPRHYLTGESSSIVRALSGGRAVPLTRGAPAAISGVDGRPTVVHNVETLAKIALIAADHRPSGSRLLTLATPTARTVVDAQPLDRLASLASGIVSHDVSAVLLGGFAGSWKRWHDVAAVPLSELNGSISAGIAITLPRGQCGVTVTAEFVRYLATSSARQCGPCLFGLGELSSVMARVARGRARRRDVERLHQVSAAVSGRGACSHPDGAIKMLGSAIDVFNAEFGAHRRSQTCELRHEPVHAVSRRVA